jgi:hypothetical protein
MKINGKMGSMDHAFPKSPAECNSDATMPHTSSPTLGNDTCGWAYENEHFRSCNMHPNCAIRLAISAYFQGCGEPHCNRVRHLASRC